MHAAAPNPNGGRNTRLHGRESEIATLSALLDAARERAGVLVVRGEAGVGKTALLDAVAAQASGFRVLRITGVESDMELAFAGLHQLCVPLLGYLDELPPPQRAALDVAFGRGAGAAPDRFMVGLAALSLLAAAAQTQPLLCVVDDAQWLDQVSMQTLGFVSRRLLAEPILLVFGVRDRPDVLGDLPQLEVRGLSDAAARELLDAVMTAGIDERVRDRIVSEARGLPLALLDVPRSASAIELAGGFWISGKRSSVAAIEEEFVRRIHTLPADTQRLLLVAAAEPVGDVALFVRVLQRLDIPLDALGAAEADDVVDIGAHVRFRHPLMRSAAYRAADLLDRRTVHRALADALDIESDADRRAWHAAHAASGPDEVVAADLAASAERSLSRGGIAAAAAYLERATTLTADPVVRGVRAIAAAEAKYEAGQPQSARTLLEVADLAPLPPRQRAEVTRIRAQMEFARSRAGLSGATTGAAARQLLSAAEGLAGLDEDVARDLHLEALAAAMYAGRLGEPTVLGDAARAGKRAMERGPAARRSTDLLLDGLSRRVLDGPGAGTHLLRAGLDAWSDAADAPEESERRWPLAIALECAAHETWDDAVLQRIAANTVRRARTGGALAVLPSALVHRAGLHVYAGELDVAETLIDEANAITASMGSGPATYHSLTLAAWRGDAAVALPMFASSAADATARGEGRLLALSRYTSAVLFNGLGRYDEALAAARECCAHEDLGFHAWCLTELIEAAVHVGDIDAAADVVPLLEARAGVSHTDWGRGTVAAARAMVADGDAAEKDFQHAIDHLQRADVAPPTARVQLCYGEWLRRTGRRSDARRQLRAAHDAFTAMGAHAFAERARRELMAAGEKVRKQPVSSGDALTAQESQIAHLASQGHTNQEIAAQLFLSAHTVEWHLRKVFVKLGVTSRRQLRTIRVT